MWTEQRLIQNLHELGVREGMVILAHTSLRSIGQIEGGAETLIHAFRAALGPEGTLLVPAFTYNRIDPACWEFPPATLEEIERLRAEAPLFDPASSPVDTRWIGMFPEAVRQQQDAFRGQHPAFSFAAIGAAAQSLTENAPFHFPLGTNSPLARLYKRKGGILLIGVGHSVNSSLHLAEVWAEAPYIRRSISIKTGLDEWSIMKGSPECSSGFERIEPLLRQSRLIKEGYIGNAKCSLMRIQELVSMAVALLRGSPSALLCSNPACHWCVLARKMTGSALPIEKEEVE